MPHTEPCPIRNPSQGRAALPELPAQIVLPDGQEVDIGGSCWEVRDISYGIVKFDFALFPTLASDTRDRLRLTIAQVLETRSASHARNLFNNFLEFYRAVLVPSGRTADVDLSDLLNYRGGLRPETDWKLGMVRILLETAEEHGVGFCTPEAPAWLDTAVIRGNPKGRDVRTRDPNGGPFTAAEMEALNSALNAAYVEGGVDLTDYAAGQLLLAFGMRPRQLMALKEKDLLIYCGKKGHKVYTLMIPQAKRGGEVLRTTFKARPCDRRIGMLLEELMEANGAKKADSAVPADEWPMFIGPDAGTNPPGLEWHIPAAIFRAHFTYHLEKRTKLQVNTRRFRDTVAQNMADDGASKYEIAELLGHADTQQIDKYLEALPELVARLNHLAVDFTPILQAFAGVLVSPDDDEARDASGEKCLHERGLPEGGSAPLGHCGEHGFCGLAKPLGCYTCRSFRPWDDGPHEAMLEMLHAKRQAQVERGLDPKIYTINDRTISAVARVVELCIERRCANGQAA